MDKKQSIGINVLGHLFILHFLCIPVLIKGIIAFRYPKNLFVEIFTKFIVILFIIGLGTSGIFLLMKKEFGRKLILWLSGITIVFATIGGLLHVTVFKLSFIDVIIALLPIYVVAYIFYPIAIYYLTRSEIKEQFKY